MPKGLFSAQTVAPISALLPQASTPPTIAGLTQLFATSLGVPKAVLPNGTLVNLGGEDGAIAALKTAAVATAAADATTLGTTTVTAVSATASSAVVTADATAPGATYDQTEAASAATLVNALKAQLNINATENADLRARQAQDKTAIDNLKITVDLLVTLGNDLKAKYNALSNGIDAL